MSSDLQSVIEASPVEIVPGDFFMSLPAPEIDGQEIFMTVDDGHERTILYRALDGSGTAPRPDAANGPYTCLRLRIAVPFEAPGFIARAAQLIAQLDANVLVVSTFSFDYLFVKKADTERSCDALKAGGFPVLESESDPASSH